jgi:HSP20 family protein
MSVLSLTNPWLSTRDPWLLARSSDPVDLFNAMQRDFGRVYDEVLRAPLARGAAAQITFLPDVDIVENDHEVKLIAELPGMDEKAVTVTVMPTSVLLSGEKKNEYKEQKQGLFRLERSYGTFQREVPLPVEVDIEKVDAKMHNGVLTVSLKKTVQARNQTRKVEIKAC